MDVTGPALTESPAAVGAEAADGRGQVLTVFSATGGIGTTTVAVNLAAVLATQGRATVCLVDLDAAFHTVAASLALSAHVGLADAARLVEGGGSIDATSLAPLLTQDPSGLSVLLAPDYADNADPVPPGVLVQVISTLRTMFDFVVIDTPATFDELVLAAFEASDLIVNVATFGVESLKDLRLTLETLGLLAAPGRVVTPEHGWRVVINRVETSAGLAAAEAARSLPVPVGAELPLSDELEGSPPPGPPLVLRSPDDPFSLALRSFVDDQLRPTQATGPLSERSRRNAFSLLRRLWR